MAARKGTSSLQTFPHLPLAVCRVPCAVCCVLCAACCVLRPACPSEHVRLGRRGWIEDCFEARLNVHQQVDHTGGAPDSRSREVQPHQGGQTVPSYGARSGWRLWRRAWLEPLHGSCVRCLALCPSSAGLCLRRTGFLRLLAWHGGCLMLSKLGAVDADAANRLIIGRRSHVIGLGRVALRTRAVGCSRQRSPLPANGRLWRRCGECMENGSR